MDGAYETKKHNGEKAKVLIDSIDNFVLEKLGVEIPELKNETCFVINSEELENSRFDAEFHRKKYKQIEQALKNGKYEISDLNFLEKAYIEDKNNKKGDKYILAIDSKEGKIKEIGVFGEGFLKKQGGVKREIKNVSYKHFSKSLVVSRINLQRGGLFILEDDVKEIFSTNEFYSFKEHKKLNLEFLKLLLRNDFFKEQINRKTSGQFGRFKEEDFKDLKIPIPPLHVQREISEEVKNRLNKAKKLKEEAKEELENAKLRVEKIILG